jgi:hypothetical protein
LISGRYKRPSGNSSILAYETRPKEKPKTANKTKLTGLNFHVLGIERPHQPLGYFPIERLDAQSVEAVRPIVGFANRLFSRDTVERHV